MITAPKQILVVDDESSVLVSMKRNIEDNFPDYVVDTAKNGFDAIQAFSQKKHGLIIMDISMPILDGIKAEYEIQTLCENRDWPMPAFIFCTGYLPPDEVRDLLKKNPSCSLLLKPIITKKLVDEIKKRMEPEGQKPAQS